MRMCVRKGVGNTGVVGTSTRRNMPQTASRQTGMIVSVTVGGENQDRFLPEQCNPPLGPTAWMVMVPEVNADNEVSRSER